MDRLAEAIGDEARLEALRRTSLLDTPPEETFDRLTRLATAVLHVPVALVSLVDGKRSFIKSFCGLTGPLASSRQTPLSHSFCKHAVASSEPLLVSDARLDPLVKDNPSVSEFGVIAYAGIPLITSEGHALGTFCVVHGEPHEWTEEEIGILRVLATSTIAEIELRRLVGELHGLTDKLHDVVETRTSELRASEERLRLLLEVNNAIVTCLDRDSLFAATAAALRPLIPFDRAALVLHDRARDVFRVLGVVDAESASAPIQIGTEWPRQGSRAGWILEHRQPISTPDLETAPSFLEHAPLIKQGIRTAVSVPMIVKGKVIGTLNVGSRTPAVYGDAEVELLAAIAEQVALAIENLLAYEQIAALKARLEEENLYLQEEARAETASGDVVGESPAILGVLANVRKVAKTDSTVSRATSA